jgi:hypothetical protein
VIVPNELYLKYGSRFHLAYGNHAAYVPSGKKFKSSEVCSLIHIPVRSRSQIVTKTLMHVIGNAFGTTHNKGMNLHIYQMLDRIAEGKLTEDEVRAFMLTYDDLSGLNSTKVSRAELLDNGYEVSTLHEMGLARNQSLNFPVVEREFSLAKQIANSLRNVEENLPNYAALHIVGNTLELDQRSLNQRWPNRMIKRVGSKLLKPKKRAINR